MPLVLPMMEEVINALPPSNALKIADLCAGSGEATIKLLESYPDAQVTLIDQSIERLQLAEKKLHAKGLVKTPQSITLLAHTIQPTNSTLPGGPYDLIISTLGLHTIAEQPAHYQTNDTKDQEWSVAERYAHIFRMVFNSLHSGGHLIVGDHVGVCPLYQQMRLMEDGGFIDIDCAWRSKDMIVYGGVRK